MIVVDSSALVEAFTAAGPSEELLSTLESEPLRAPHIDVFSLNFS
jgi:hypothetical protein